MVGDLGGGCPAATDPDTGQQRMTPEASGFEPVAGCSSGAAYPGLVTRAWCACLARALGAWWPGVPGSAGLAGVLIGPTGPAVLPGAGGWAVAADDLGP